MKAWRAISDHISVATLVRYAAFIAIFAGCVALMKAGSR